MKLIHIIADYGAGDLAFSEIVSALSGAVPQDYHLHLTSVASFDTIATGFAVAQLGLQEVPFRPEEFIVYANCAPRKDSSEARMDNEGEGILYGVLRNGVPVAVVNSGYSLSFIKDDLAELWTVNAGNGGSQFRSRDNFPPIIGMIAKNDLSFVQCKIDPAKTIPDAPKQVVGYIDSFGNLKTTIRDCDEFTMSLKPGSRVDVTINGIHRAVTVASGSFNVKDGDIALAPGSSGHRRKFWEIFQRGGNAWATFGKPRVGSRIEFVKS